jgi:hypothetical protein
LCLSWQVSLSIWFVTAAGWLCYQYNWGLSSSWCCCWDSFIFSSLS